MTQDIPGYDGMYQVTDSGKVFSVRSKRFLNPKPYSCGYVYVVLFRNGDRERHMVHRLVAKAFIESSTDNFEVNHINGIKHDNRKENLEWVSRSENIKHAISIGLKKSSRGEQNGQSKLTWENVAYIRKVGDSVTKKELASKFGVDPAVIRRVLNNESWVLQ